MKLKFNSKFTHLIFQIPILECKLINHSGNIDNLLFLKMQGEVDRLIQDVYLKRPERGTIENDNVLKKIRDGLKCLGRHPLILKHAFLELKAMVNFNNEIRSLYLKYIFV